MDELNPLLAVMSSPPTTEPAAKTDALPQTAIARGSGHIEKVPAVPEGRERTEHSVMEGLPGWKQERVASMRKELAELQRQLLESQQRTATELQGRADDAERYEALEARLQAQEDAANEHTTRRVELETELETLRTSAAELRRELTTRDAQIDESRRQHRSLSQQFEAQTEIVNESKSSRETHETELFKLREARDEAQATTTRVEREATEKLEAQRKEHREATEKLDAEITFLRDAQKASAGREAELTSDRDAIKGELEAARRDLETARAKTRDIATQLVRIGNALTEGNGAGGATEHSASSDESAIAVPQITRPQPPPTPPLPPLPPPRAAEPEKVEAIFDVADIEEQAPVASRLRSVLLLVAGVVVGCGATFALTHGGPSTTAASYRDDVGAQPAVSLTAPAASENAPAPLAAPLAAETAPTPLAVPPPVPTPPLATLTTTNAPSSETSAPAIATSTDGVIVLPESAVGHRVFVDGKVAEVKNARAVTSCGTHKLRIGSSGTERTIDVECGGATAIAADPGDR